MTSSRLRLHLLLIVTLAGVVAFLASVAALSAGLDSMAVRYPVAAVCGYVTFLLLVRVWVAWYRPSGERRDDRASDLVDIDVAAIEVPVPTRWSRGSDALPFAGGRSGGAGGGASWGSGGKSANPAFDLDVEELWPLVLAAACVLGGAIAIGYVIYSAPVMLAEVAVDAAIVSGVYRRLKRRESSYWAVTALRHTALPAAAVIVFAAVAGGAAQLIAPEARSIGGVIRALTE